MAALREYKQKFVHLTEFHSDPQGGIMTFDQWWYDYRIKNGLSNPQKMKNAAQAAWDAAAAVRDSYAQDCSANTLNQDIQQAPK